MISDNRIIVDINKVTHARFFYRNQHGDERNKLFRASLISVRNCIYEKDEPVKMYSDILGEFVNTNVLSYSISRSILDIWQPVLHLQCSSTHKLEYTGDKATELWKAWCAKIFKKRGK